MRICGVNYWHSENCPSKNENVVSTKSTDWVVCHHQNVQMNAYTFVVKSRLKCCPILPNLILLKLDLVSTYLYDMPIRVCMMIRSSDCLCLFSYLCVLDCLYMSIYTRQFTKHKTCCAYGYPILLPNKMYTPV